MLTTLIFVLGACAPQNEEAFLTTRSAASSENMPSRWPANAFPIQLNISDAFSPDEADAVKDMANQWSLSTNNKINFFDTTGNTTEKGNVNINSYNDGQMAIYKLTTWPTEFPASALAVTQVFGTKINVGSSSAYIKIEHADIMINYEGFDFSTDYGFGYDFQTVVLHEMGHFLGLYHDNTSSVESIMFPSISRFRDNRSPKERDTINIETLYGVNSSVTAANKNFIPTLYPKESFGEKVVIIYEMYPGGKEKSFIKKVTPRGREKK